MNSKINFLNKGIAIFTAFILIVMHVSVLGNFVVAEEEMGLSATR